MESKYTVTVDVAIKKGMVTLVWIPLLIVFVPTVTGILFYRHFEEWKLSFFFIVCGFLLGLAISWWWWSIEVVRWKIWAYSNVADIFRLEQKAIRKKMIWRRGSWFEKTEIASVDERAKLNELLQRFSEPRIVEWVDDPRFYFEYTVGFSKIGLIIGFLFTAGSIYLIIDGDKIWVGVFGLVVIGWMLRGLLTKMIRKKYFLKVDEDQITLEGSRVYKWSQVSEFFVDQTGIGKNATHFLVIRGEDFYERLDMEDIDRGADFIEHLLEVYYTRYLGKTKKPS